MSGSSNLRKDSKFVKFYIEIQHFWYKTSPFKLQSNA